MRRSSLKFLIILGICILSLPGLAQTSKYEPVSTHNDSPLLHAFCASHPISQLELDAGGVPLFLEGDLTPAQRTVTPLEMAYAFFWREPGAVSNGRSPRRTPCGEDDRR